ncbi:His-Xaa-Ser system radical SAM maturase HxsB [Alcaligenaceae bacterium]|nr:His-Xaa-Ser system radical SAM maturase HxsB [Alcaligenaceae bacterium]
MDSWHVCAGYLRSGGGRVDRYAVQLLPHQTRRIGEKWLAVSSSGDHVFLDDNQLQALSGGHIQDLSLDMQARLKSRFFIGSHGQAGSRRLLASRKAARHETVQTGPGLHIIVPTLQCAHSCQYCQVSRSLSDAGHTLSKEDLHSACDAIFQSFSPSLTIEFQGGDPLLRFDLLQEAILRIEELNRAYRRRIRFVVASTLHQLNEDMCRFFGKHGVLLSTSIDGPAALHNRNRPVPGRDAYERTLIGIDMARGILGHHAVSALMTTTKASLEFPEAIVDEYVKLGFQDIFLRPLSSYGFAKRNQALLGYKSEQFQDFYRKALARVFWWNREGVALREVYASVVLNKILSPFDGGYVDLQSPTGAGQSVLVYNYDGYVYPSDEARMLAETGDVSLRLGRIGTPLSALQASPVQQALVAASTVSEVAGCRTCAFQSFCAPNPVDAQAQFGRFDAPVLTTEHCLRHQWLFDFFFETIRNADDELLDLLHTWARPAVEESVCAE